MSSSNCCNSWFDCTSPSCLCFRAEVYCSEHCMCHCTKQCFNRSSHGTVVEKLRDEFKSRDPFAFPRDVDIRERQEETPEDGVVALPSPDYHDVTANCNCSESQCLDKQCCACLQVYQGYCFALTLLFANCMIPLVERCRMLMAMHMFCRM